VNESKYWEKENLLLSTDKHLLQLERIHHFLSTEAYWSLGIPLKVVEKAIHHSLCFGLYDRSSQEPGQIGFARVVSDGATFAWICDVYVDTAHRGKGHSKWMMECLMAHPDLQGLRRICLATKDAHQLYVKSGFRVTETPGNWMEIKDNEIYKPKV
jgi:GNAT superfamily N-acetyltransferase